MADILCPHCGMPNAAEQSVCSFCLKSLQAAQNPEVYHPGDAPTKKTTAELEPVLPEWLRDAREKARRADAEKAAEDAQTAAEQPAPKKEEPPDFLAGLASVGGDDQDEEIPDWMRSAPPVSTPSIEKEKTFPRRQEIRWEGDSEDELGGMATTPVPTPPESGDALLPWMQGADAASAESDDVADWLKKAAPDQSEQPISPFASGSFKPPSTGELTDWLDQATTESTAKPATDSDDSLNDWLSNLPRGETPATADESNEPFDGALDLPDWMKREEPSAPPEKEEEAPAPWMGAFGETAQAKSEPPASDWMPRAQSFSETEGETELPAWMGAFGESAAPAEGTSEPPPPDWTPPAESVSEQKAEADLPSWLASFGETAAAAAQASIEPPPPDWTPPAEKKPESPDWMDAFRASDAATAAETPASPEVPRAAAFISSEESSAESHADELFASEMPDWLSNIAPVESKPSEVKETAQEAIAPAELPSWVQAMRPVETALPNAPAVIGEGPLEDRGPLAGLRGVLPLAGIIQPGKPKAQAIRLQADESQQASAALLEQMLSAETQAKPLRGGGTLVSQRALRWAIAALLILIVILPLMAGLRTVPLPAALPAESALILPALELLPQGAPVLMIFDYDPALAGELEAAAVPLLDRFLASRHPRVTVLSTSPTGPALAEKLFTRALRNHGYQPGAEYLNLGYLPGGNAGILYFAEYPHKAIPTNDWDLPAAQGVTRFGDYAAVILLTDQSETARAWIEQTTLQRDDSPMIVISSAQAAPMILPYALSGQIAGLTSGLHGGAAFTSNAADSSARDYWDAYQFAALFAAAMIVLGGLWNFVAGARARRQGMEEA